VPHFWRNMPLNQHASRCSKQLLHWKHNGAQTKNVLKRFEVNVGNLRFLNIVN